MSTIPDIMHSVSEVLTTAEELLGETDSDHEVAVMLASYLKTLLVELEKLRDASSPRTTPAHAAPKANPQAKTSNARVKKTKRPVVNKYKNACARCGKALAEGEGFVLPTEDPNASKKWLAFCEPDYSKEIEWL